MPSGVLGGVGGWGGGVAGEGCLTTSCVVLRSLETESRSCLATALAHKYHQGGFPRNFGQPLQCFVSHCLPAPLGASTVRAAANTGRCSPRTPGARSHFLSTLGSWSWQDVICSAAGPASQGIGSVSQLVEQSGGGNTHSAHPIPLPVIIITATNNCMYRKKPLHKPGALDPSITRSC